MRFAEAIDGDGSLVLVGEGGEGYVLLVIGDPLIDLIRDDVDMRKLIKDLGQSKKLCMQRKIIKTEIS